MNDSQLMAVLEERRPASVRYATVRDALIERKVPMAARRNILLEIGEYLNGKLTKGKPDYWTFPDGNKAKFDRFILQNSTVLQQAFIEAYDGKGKES